MPLQNPALIGAPSPVGRGGTAGFPKLKKLSTTTYTAIGASSVAVPGEAVLAQIDGVGGGGAGLGGTGSGSGGGGSGGSAGQALLRLSGGSLALVIGGGGPGGYGQQQSSGMPPGDTSVSYAGKQVLLGKAGVNCTAFFQAQPAQSGSFGIDDLGLLTKTAFLGGSGADTNAGLTRAGSGEAGGSGGVGAGSSASQGTGGGGGAGPLGGVGASGNAGNGGNFGGGGGGGNESYGSGAPGAVRITFFGVA